MKLPPPRLEEVKPDYAPVHLRAGDDRSYTLNYPYGYATWSPWFEDWFQEIYRRVEPHTLVTADRCFVLHQLARQNARRPGAFAECGVYRGGTALLLAEATAGSGKPLHLFDTFAGMPAEAADDPGVHSPGHFDDTSLDRVRNLLAPHECARLHPGRLPATLAEVAQESFSLVHLDVDLFATTRDCLEFFHPRLVPGGALVIDDYGFELYRDTVRRAVDEFFADRPEVPLALRSGQALLVRLP